MRIIYQPKGKAQEYAESALDAGDGYAANIYSGCTNGCAYCYVPSYHPWKGKENPREEFHKQSVARKDVLKLLEKDLIEMDKNGLHNNPLHLCFTCDPYPEEGSEITRECLLLMEKYRMRNVQILTKGGLRASRDFDLLRKNGWKFGSTVVGVKEDYYTKWENHGLGQAGWEPNATLFFERELAIESAHNMGIFTWVSIEPVIDTVEALEVIYRLKGSVDLWKIGKLNHGKQISPECAAIEKQTDWRDFVSRAKELLENDEVVWKKSLRKYME